MGKAALALLLLCTPAVAEHRPQPCYPVSEVRERLAEAGQRPINFGIEQTGLLTFVFRNPDTFEWTLLIKTGRFQETYFCIIARGVGWKSLVPGRKL